MKFLLVASLGLLIGAAAAGAVIYYNPLTDDEAPQPDVADRTLHYALPSEVLGFTLGDHVLPPGTAKMRRFLGRDDRSHRDAQPRARRRATTTRPPSRAAARGLAAHRLPVVGVRVNDYWLLTIPGEGTLFLRADTNVWPFLKETLLPVWFFGRPWTGPADYRPTAGAGRTRRRRRDRCVPGRFAGLEGSAIEKYRLTDLDPASRSAAAVGELHLRLGASQSRGRANSEPAGRARDALNPAHHVRARIAEHVRVDREPAADSFLPCANSRGLFTASTAISRASSRGSTPRSFASRGRRVRRLSS